MYRRSWKFQMQECEAWIDKDSGRLLEWRTGFEREKG